MRMVMVPKLGGDVREPLPAGADHQDCFMHYPALYTKVRAVPKHFEAGIPKRTFGSE